MKIVVAELCDTMCEPVAPVVPIIPVFIGPGDLGQKICPGALKVEGGVQVLPYPLCALAQQGHQDEGLRRVSQPQYRETQNAILGAIPPKDDGAGLTVHTCTRCDSKPSGVVAQKMHGCLNGGDRDGAWMLMPRQGQHALMDPRKIIH